MRPSSRLVAILVLGSLSALASLAAPAARADAWCAWPLYVQEWGVHVFGGDGASLAADPWPDWFHTTVGGGVATAQPVRELPVDMGVRKLPVLHFYALGAPSEPIPVGVEVGFSQGPAAEWWPQVDLFRTAGDANGALAGAARKMLLAARAARPSHLGGPPLPADPTRQLVWTRLELTAAPTHAASATSSDWIAKARELPALWVNAASESDRFVFYEAQTAERTPLTLRRGAAWKADRRAYELANGGATAVHDVILVTRDGAATFVVSAAAIEPGQSLAFVLEDHAVAPERLAAETRERLRAALLDPASPLGPTLERGGAGGDCVMDRDPAIPFERASGHHLYRGEVDLVLGAWGARFFDQPGTTVVYREDEALLDEVMPLSIYTSMYTYAVLSRAGLALWQPVRLP
ncbi:MAG: hypothetical protein U1F43_04530 [Myxococcota bacterium]